MCESGDRQVCLDICVSLCIGCVNSSICIHVDAYIFDRVLDSCVCMCSGCVYRKMNNCYGIYKKAKCSYSAVKNEKMVWTNETLWHKASYGNKEVNPLPQERNGSLGQQEGSAGQSVCH